MARLHERSKADYRAEKTVLAAGSSPFATFKYAWAGLVWAWTKERNFRVECMIGALAVALALFLKVNPTAIVLATMLVLGLELINSAVEATVDLITPDFHPLARVAKDLAAAAVLMASFGAAVIGLITLGPALWRLLAGYVIG
ncbi:MAG: diacylglycerol kinase family protein [Deinococcota bacterium]|nr:diacylglycerol kinase family protein [Deinococcota bacterium]